MPCFYKVTLALAAVALAAPGFRAAPGPKLTQKLAEARMTLTPPPGWEETPVVTNGQMEYDYALRFPGRRLEVRYAVHPLAGYARSKSGYREYCIEKFRITALRVNAGSPVKPSGATHFNLGYSLPLKVLEKTDAQANYGADLVEMSPIEPGLKFGQTYAHCVLVGMYKKGCAEAYCFYLFDKQQEFDTIVLGDPAFHSLRFQ